MADLADLADFAADATSGLVAVCWLPARPIGSVDEVNATTFASRSDRFGADLAFAPPRRAELRSNSFACSRAV